MFVEYNHTDRGGQNDVCPKIILTHAQFRKKDECDTKLCDMIQAVAMPIVYDACVDKTKVTKIGHTKITNGLSSP